MVLLWLRRPPPPLWPIVFLCQGFALLWVLADLWASHASSMSEKQIALSLLFTGSLVLPPLWWETARRYVLWHGLGGRRLRSGWARLPLWIGVTAWTFAVTNPWHGQLMTPMIGARNDWHWGAELLSYVYYGMVLATFALCAWAARRHSGPQVRSKMALLGGAVLAPLATELIHVYGPLAPREDKIAVGLGVASVVVIYGITRNRLFNLIPVGLHEIIQRDPSGVLLLDRGGHLLLWNPAAEKLLESVLLEPDMPLLRVLARQLRDASSGEPVEGEAELTRILSTPDPASEPQLFRYAGGGGERSLRLSVTPIPTRQERIAAVCLRIEDATRDERAAQDRRSRRDVPRRTQASDDGLALVASGVARDFNNVLGTVAGRARMALDDSARGLPVRRHLKAITKAVEIAAGLTEQLQAYAHGSTFEREPLDLSQLVAESRDLLDDCLPSSVLLRCELAARLPSVHGDPTQLRQVLINLVTNAGEAIGEGREGVVGIRTFALDLDETRRQIEPGRYVLLEVSDTGIGLEESERDRIFEAYYSTKAAGRGLGLAVVYRIVESHRGAITVMCLRGSGATFQVWLPASANGVAHARLAV